MRERDGRSSSVIGKQFFSEGWPEVGVQGKQEAEGLLIGAWEETFLQGTQVSGARRVL